MKKILATIILGMFLISFASAFNFDDKIKFTKDITTSKYGRYDINNCDFWLLTCLNEGEKLATYELIENDFDLFEGYAIIEIEIFEKEKLSNDLNFYKGKNGVKTNIQESNIYYEFIENKEVELKNLIKVCDEFSETGNIICHTEENGTIKKNVQEKYWKEYKGEILDIGKYKLKITGTRKDVYIKNIDWVINSGAGDKPLKEWATWWDNNWNYELPIQINTTLTDVSNYSIEIRINNTLNFQGYCQSDFGDLRFANSSKSGELGIWFKNNTHLSDQVDVFVFLDRNLTSISNMTIYAYCNTSSIKTTTSNISSAFIFGDDFKGSAVDWANKWQSNSQANYVVGNDSLYFSVTNGSNFIITQNSFSNIEILSRAALKDDVGGSSGGIYIPASKTASFGGTTDTQVTAGNIWYFRMGAGEVSQGGQVETWHRHYIGIPQSGNGYHNMTFDSGTQVLNMTGHAPDGTPNYIAFLQGNGGTSLVDWVAGNRYVDPNNKPTYDYGTMQELATISINLNLPVNSFNTTSRNVTFEGNSTSPMGILNISLLINNVKNQTIYNTTSQQNLTLSRTLNFTDGNYTWNLETCDDSGCINGTERSFKIDTTPNINFTSPTPNNNTNITINSFQVNITTTEIYFNNVTFNLFNGSHFLLNSSTYTDSTRIVNYSGLNSGIYYFNVTARTITNQSNSTETRQVRIDTTPGIVFTSPTPTNNTNSSKDNFQVNVSLTESYFSNVTFNLFNGSHFLLNSSTYTDSTRIVNYSGLNSGIYYFNVTTKTNTGDENSTETRHIRLDTGIDENNLTQPSGMILFHILGNNLTANWTANDSSVFSCSLSYNNTNIPVNCISQNYSFTPVLNYENITLRVNDSVGNSLLNTSYWYYKILEVNQTYNNESLEGSTETFNIIIQTNESLSIANLIYNNTINAASFLSLGGNLISISEDIVIPGVSADTNVSFYWNFILANGNNINTSIINQTIKNINIDDCSAFSVLLLNYTLKDEDTRAELNGSAVNSSIELDVNLFPTTSETSVLNFSKKYLNETNAQVCLNINLTEDAYRLDAKAKYETSLHSTEYNHIQKLSLNNDSVPQNIDLLDLLISEATIFNILFKDNDFQALENAAINILREYVSEGTSISVEIPKTDSEGQAVAHLIQNDVEYNIIVSKDQEIIKVIEGKLAVCQDPTILECDLSLNAFEGGDTLPDFETFENLNLVASFDESTRTTTALFSTTDNSVIDFNVTSRVFDSFGNRTICSNEITTSSGSVDCVVPVSFGNITLISEFRKDGEIIKTTINTIEPSAEDNFGQTGYFFLILLLLTLPGMAASKTYNGSLLLLVLGVVFAFLLNIADGGTLIGEGSTLIWLIISIGILIYKNKGVDDSGF